MTEVFFDGGNAGTDFSTTDGAIDYTLPAGQIRLLISDVDLDPTRRLFTDAQLTGFMAVSADNIFRAAALAVRTIATSEVLISKVVRMQNGTTTDGAKVAAELRALADELDARANADERAAAASVFEFVPLYESHAEAAERGIVF